MGPVQRRLGALSSPVRGRSPGTVDRRWVGNTRLPTSCWGLPPPAPRLLDCVTLLGGMALCVAPSRFSTLAAWGGPGAGRRAPDPPACRATPARYEKEKSARKVVVIILRGLNEWLVQLNILFKLYHNRNGVSGVSTGYVVDNRNDPEPVSAVTWGISHHSGRLVNKLLLC